MHVQGENTPTPVAARVIGSLTGDLAPSWRPASFSPSSTICSPPAAEPAAPAHPPGRSEPGHRHVPGRLRGEVQPLCGAHQGGPAAAHGLPWPGNYIQLRAFLERMVLTAPARTVNDGYVRSLLEELYPSRWSAPRGRPSPAAVSPRPPGWRRCSPATAAAGPRPPPSLASAKPPSGGG